MWGQKAPPKRANGGRKRPCTNQSRKSVEAKSAVKMQKWGKKRHHSDKQEKSYGGEKCHQNGKVVAENDIKTVK